MIEDNLKELSNESTSDIIPILIRDNELTDAYVSCRVEESDAYDTVINYTIVPVESMYNFFNDTVDASDCKNGVWYDENEHDLYIIGQNYTKDDVLGQNYTKMSFRPYKEW